MGGVSVERGAMGVSAENWAMKGCLNTEGISMKTGAMGGLCGERGHGGV